MTTSGNPTIRVEIDADWDTYDLWAEAYDTAYYLMPWVRLMGCEGIDDDRTRAAIEIRSELWAHVVGLVGADRACNALHDELSSVSRRILWARDPVLREHPHCPLWRSERCEEIDDRPEEEEPEPITLAEVWEHHFDYVLYRRRRSKAPPRVPRPCSNIPRGRGGVKPPPIARASATASKYGCAAKRYHTYPAASAGCNCSMP